MWKLIKGMIFKNPKTTASGLPAAIVAILKVFGVNVPEEVVIGAITLSTFLIGLFSKDAPSDKPSEPKVN
jgi:hypothetical protein